MSLPRAAVALVAALLAPAAARAQPVAALRLSYAPALGDVVKGVPMADAMSSHVPVQLDALWRFGAASAGAYVSWGPGQVSDTTCGAGASCSASVLRAGLQGLWAFAPLGATRVVPWAGAGLGWEWAASQRERLGARARYTWSGAELSLQGGAEWPVAARFALGPAVLLGMGRYAREALDTSAGSGAADVGTKALHVWIHVGLRGRVDF